MPSTSSPDDTAEHAAITEREAGYKPFRGLPANSAGLDPQSAAMSTAPTPTRPGPPRSAARRPLPAPRPGVSHHAARFRRAALHLPNWWQFGRFLAVGATGYVVNLAVFAFGVHILKLEYHASAILAFIVASINTFLMNRHWTFNAGHGSAKFQGPRYLIVNLIGFGVNLGALDLFVQLAAMPKVPAEAIAALVAAPVNFLGQRLWVFTSRPRAAQGRSRRAAA